MDVTRESVNIVTSVYSSTLGPAASPATNAISWDNLVHSILDLLLLGPTSLLLFFVVWIGSSSGGTIRTSDMIFVCLQFLGIRPIRRFRLSLLIFRQS